jgi:hypothetical protein
MEITFFDNKLNKIKDGKFNLIILNLINCDNLNMIKKIINEKPPNNFFWGIVFDKSSYHNLHLLKNKKNVLFIEFFWKKYFDSNNNKHFGYFGSLFKYFLLFNWSHNLSNQCIIIKENIKYLPGYRTLIKRINNYKSKINCFLIRDLSGFIKLKPLIDIKRPVFSDLFFYSNVKFNKQNIYYFIQKIENGYFESSFKQYLSRSDIENVYNYNELKGFIINIDFIFLNLKIYPIIHRLNRIRNPSLNIKKVIVNSRFIFMNMKLYRILSSIKGEELRSEISKRVLNSSSKKNITEQFINYLKRYLNMDNEYESLKVFKKTYKKMANFWTYFNENFLKDTNILILPEANFVADKKFSQGTKKHFNIIVNKQKFSNLS